MKKVIFTSVLLAIPTFLLLRGEPPVDQRSQELVVTAEDEMEDLQAKLSDDPNQAQLWFQLGQGYLANQELSSALTCFDYAIRLTPKPSASFLVGKATAMYYLDAQTITVPMRELLDAALDLDPYHPAALTLIANDHFISFRYQQAIEIWTKLLNSDRVDIDREKIILSLNQAKAMIQK